MAARRKQIKHAEIVERFAAQLRLYRRQRGLTQAELAAKAQITVSYMGRLENAGAAPGIDLIERLATALGTTIAELLPSTAPTDTAEVFRDQANRLLTTIIKTADRETLATLNPLLALIARSTGLAK